MSISWSRDILVRFQFTAVTDDTLSLRVTWAIEFFFGGRVINDFLKIHDRYYYVSSLLSITLHDDSYLCVSRNHLSLGPGLFIDLIYSKGPVEFLFLNISSTTDLIYSNFQGSVIFAKHCKIYGAHIEIYENFGEPWLNPNLEGPFCYS